MGINVKCFLFLDHFVSPIKILVMENIDENATDEQIIKEAKENFLKGFRVEIEDINNPLHPPYGYNKKVEPIVKLKDTIEVIDQSTLRVNGEILRPKDVRKVHNLGQGRYNYLRCILKHSLIDIYIHGNKLMKRKKF